MFGYFLDYVFYSLCDHSSKRDIGGFYWHSKQRAGASRSVLQRQRSRSVLQR
ncbi:MAG: hypothetical protein HQL03_03820 [Nitrospirae bacterium]|nr:hypothetical protein [Nitrospirota bacterium]